MCYQSSKYAVALTTAVLAAPSLAQVVAYGKYPAFMGQWTRTGPPNNWRQLAGPPPLTPQYQKVFAQRGGNIRQSKPDEKVK